MWKVFTYWRYDCQFTLFARTSAALAAMMFVGTAASTAPRISILIGNQNVPRNAIQI